MADNYLGRQSRTDGGAVHVTRPFQVPDTRTARGQHGPAARQSRVQFPVTDTDAGPMSPYFNFVSRSTRRGFHPAFSLQVYTARARCRREPSMQTLTTRRTAIHKQGTKANVLIRLTLTVRQTRLCSVQQPPAKKKRSASEQREWTEMNRLDRNDSTDEEILVFIRRDLDELNSSAGILHLPGSHKDRKNDCGDFQFRRIWTSGNDFITNTIANCPLFRRCGCKCQAKIVQTPVQTILSISNPHTAADHLSEK